MLKHKGDSCLQKDILHTFNRQIALGYAPDTRSNEEAGVAVLVPDSWN